MSLSYNYGTLSAAIQAWSDINSTDMVLNITDIMAKGELRLYHALDLDNLDPVVSTTAVNGLTSIVSKPANLIRERTVQLVPPVNSSLVSLLMHFDGAAGSTTFTDSSYNETWTANNGAVISTTNPKFGTGCFAPNANNSSGAYLSAPSSVGGGLDLGSNNFTVEGWFNLNGYTSGTGTQMLLMDLTNGFTTGFRIYISQSSAGVIQVQAQGTGNGNVAFGSYNVVTANTAVSLGTWHHFAFVRSNGNVFTLYLDGVPGTPFQGVSGTVGTGFNSGYWYICGGYLAAVQDSYFNGSVDEFRVSQYAVYTGAFTPPTAAFANPVNTAGGATAILRKCSYEFAVQYLLDCGANQGPPKYYSEYSSTQWQLAGPVDQTYTLLVRGIFRPTLLADNPETTNLAGIAALQHPTASTPLTLTTSPFVYANNTPSLPSSQLWFYSAGNMSANTFTVVGLDDDGNAQTETVTGPNGGSVQTVGVYSQITSVTPSATDNVNYVSLGWSQDNSTWLSTRFPDLLFWHCIQEACQFNKRWSAAQMAEQEIAKLMPAAQAITRSLKRNDFDDLYSGRQNVGAPGAVPLPVPPQTGQTQGPGR